MKNRIIMGNSNIKSIDLEEDYEDDEYYEEE